jgi:hypothetical protein
MFRSIGGTLEKKRNNLIKTGAKSSDISLMFDKFLNDYFFEYKDLFNWEASYSPKDGKVIISTGSKLIAGELSLKIKEFSRILKEANLKVTQIIII